MKYFSVTFVLFFNFFLVAQTLKPYKNPEEMIKDLDKNSKIVNEINKTNKGDKKYYVLLGDAFTLQGIVCKRAEISPLVIVEQAFLSIKKQQSNAQIDYIIFTDGCRNMYGLYR